MDRWASTLSADRMRPCTRCQRNPIDSASQKQERVPMAVDHISRMVEPAAQIITGRELQQPEVVPDRGRARRVRALGLIRCCGRAGRDDGWLGAGPGASPSGEARPPVDAPAQVRISATFVSNRFSLTVLPANGPLSPRPQPGKSGPCATPVRSEAIRTASRRQNSR